MPVLTALPPFSRLKEHSQRLLNSAKILRLNIPYTVDEISQGILDTLKPTR